MSRNDFADMAMGEHDKPVKGMHLERYFTKAGGSMVEYNDDWWERRTAVITGEDGKVVFKQKDVEVPKSWSQLALNVVASKYFRGTPGTLERENSVKHLVDRVAGTIADWGMKNHYFSSSNAKLVFFEELRHMLLHQVGSFNSPVWFNVGVKREDGKQPQCSACFINSVEDSMESILDLAKTEGMLFKGGSGTGTNLSPLRSSKELLAGGGTASGPVSFMRGFDAFAGVIKSGGKTRRAAKMVVLNADHPDIMEFINCKAHEEKKAHALIAAGYDGKFNGEAYQSISFQNANNSVRLTDNFFRQLKKGHSWNTIKKNGDLAENIPAKTIFHAIAEAAHFCGDPGVQYDDAIQKWHTCKSTGRINASNPCSEFVFLDDTACNLASLNLMAFYNAETKAFDVDGFKYAVNLFILAQEILVGMSSYPTPKIEKNSHDFRPLGLGYCNLGALLMTKGLPYDSDEGRNYAAAITSLMGGQAYLQSAEIASRLGAFSGYQANEIAMDAVLTLHDDAAHELCTRLIGKAGHEIALEGSHAWHTAKTAGRLHGFRNAQVTVLAPTGTIAFMMV